MRSLAAIAFSFSGAILLLSLLPAGSWPLWAVGVLALAGGGLLFLPRLCRTKRLRVCLLQFWPQQTVAAPVCEGRKKLRLNEIRPG